MTEFPWQLIQTTVAVALMLVAVPYVLKQDQYIKHLRKMIVMFPSEVVCGVRTFKDEVLHFVAEDMAS